MDDTPLLPTLPMHLMMTMGYLLSSPFALRCASGASAPSKPASKKSRGKNPPQSPLENAVAQEAQRRAAELLQGVERYVEEDYSRNVAEKPPIWHCGSARLLDYGLEVCNPAAIESVVLFIPSLINRYYILDLEEERSMLRYLADNNIYPLVLDWGEPGKFEASFGCDEYVTEILLPCIDFIQRAVGRKIALAGYCMGGVLALAAAQLRPKQVSGLALLATPWNFHCKAFLPFVVDEEWQTRLASMIKSQKTLPAHVIQALFYMTDPWVFENKFRRFASLNPKSQDAHDFVALEHWVNDGVPMTANVAHDCLIEWAQNNMLAQGDWMIGKEIISPRKLKLPTFIALPKSDHVVPLDCAQPLADALPKSEIINPSAGHVGMIVGHRAKKELWQPLIRWLGKKCK